MLSEVDKSWNRVQVYHTEVESWRNQTPEELESGAVKRGCRKGAGWR